MRLKLSLPEAPPTGRVGRLFRSRFPGRVAPVQGVPEPRSIPDREWVEEAWWQAGPVTIRARATAMGDLTHLGEALGDLATPAPPTHGAEVLSLIRTRSEEVDSFVIHLGDELIATGDSVAQVARVSMLALGRRAIEARPDRLHLHAALAVRGDRAALILGPRQAGKSTLAAAAGLQGWVIHADEQVAMSMTDGGLVGFPRPVVLRADMVERMDLPPGRPMPEVVPLRLFGRPTHPAEVRPNILIVPEAGPGQPAMEEIEPAEAFMILLAETLDADRHGSVGDDALAALARSVPAMRLRFQEPAIGARLLDEVDLPSPATAPAVERVDGARRAEGLPSTLPLSGRSRLCRGAATGYGFGSGGVIIGTSSRVLALVDPTGFSLWCRIDGRVCLDTLADEMGVDRIALTDFAAELSRLHLVESP